MKLLISKEVSTALQHDTSEWLDGFNAGYKAALNTIFGVREKQNANDPDPQPDSE